MTAQAELELGDSLAKSEQPREAEACYSRAIQADPEALAPRFRRAHVRLFELDDAQGALEDLVFVQEHNDGRPGAPPISHLEHLLGEALFHDTSLSFNRSQACATCHMPERAFSPPQLGKLRRFYYRRFQRPARRTIGRED